jgi:hypothetical protein
MRMVDFFSHIFRHVSSRGDGGWEVRSLRRILSSVHRETHLVSCFLKGRCYTVPRHCVVFHGAPPKNRKKQICLLHVLLKRKVWSPTFSPWPSVPCFMLSFPTICKKILLPQCEPKTATRGTFLYLLWHAWLVHGRKNCTKSCKECIHTCSWQNRKKHHIYNFTIVLLM